MKAKAVKNRRRQNACETQLDIAAERARLQIAANHRSEYLQLLAHELHTAALAGVVPDQIK